MALVTLRVLDGADRGTIYEGLSTPVTIGREEGNSIQLNDERVSRFHLKIQEDQDKLVLTDLESTNGTKVNGEDVQLRILRFGDMVSLGRSVLLFGSREQIAGRLASLRGADPHETGSLGPGHESEHRASLEFELGWTDDPLAQTTFQALQPPELPERLSPGQAAQLSELLEYLHIRMRDLLSSVRIEGQAKRISLDERQWQSVLDLQARLAGYLKAIGEPSDERD
jgi:pSer/pThr/pTyr-binding forkhead associated (FHA) protein